MLDLSPDHLACPSHRAMQETLPTSFIGLLESASVETMLLMQEAISAKLVAKKTEKASSPVTKQSAPPTDIISSMVEHVEDLNLDSLLVEGIEAELQSLQLKRSTKKVVTQWLSPSSDSYNYGNITNKPKSISDFPNISKLMDIVNLNPATSNDMDACLVSFFPSSKASLSLHKDDEDLISQSSSICTVSFGAPRSLEFVLDGKRKKGRPDLTADLSLPATNLSMNVMKPGAQSLMKHRVKAGMQQPNQPNTRYSISFRKIARPEHEDPVEHPSPPDAPIIDSKVPKTASPPKKNVILIAGDSFPARLNVERLGKGKKDVRNISSGGSKISKVQKSIEDFVQDNPNVVVKKLFVCIGANDIRHCTNGVKHLKNSVCELMKRIKELLPLATVYFQSIPPIHPNGCMYTPRNVVSMNNLIYNLCSRFRLFYLNIFDAFLNKHWTRNDSLFPKYDENKKSFDIHPNSKGMGVLARFYIYLIHSRRFNPMGY